MIAMEPEGSTEGFLRKKIIPAITVFELVSWLFMFGAGIGVIIKEEAHAAISSVDIQTAPILLLVAGSLSLLVALLGIYFMKRCPTLNDIRTALIVLFMVLLALATLLVLIAGGYGINYSKKVKDNFGNDLKNGIENYGRTGYETMANIDRLQKQDKCCGVFTYADWRATTYGGHRYDKVPDSCCKTEEYACGFKFKDEATLNKMGCASVAVDKMDKDLMIVGVGGIVIGIVELILFIVFLTCYLCNRCTPDQPIAAVSVEYHKTVTPSDDDGQDGQDSSGGVEEDAQKDSASDTHHEQGREVKLSPQGSRSGAKATLAPLPTKGAPKTSEETKTEKQKKKRVKSKQGKG